MPLLLYCPAVVDARWPLVNGHVFFLFLSLSPLTKLGTPQEPRIGFKQRSVCFANTDPCIGWFTSSAEKVPLSTLARPQVLCLSVALIGDEGDLKTSCQRKPSRGLSSVVVDGPAISVSSDERVD